MFGPANNVQRLPVNVSAGADLSVRFQENNQQLGQTGNFDVVITISGDPR